MKKIYFLQSLLFVIFAFFATNSFAWNHSFEVGYGYSHDPNEIKYNNSQIMLSGDIFPLYRNTITFWSITGSLSQLHTTAPKNKNVTTAAMSLALRLYPFPMFTHSDVYFPYVLASAGPAYLSKQRLGINTQGSHMSIQTNLGFGTEIKNFDINLRLSHYSNANLADPNQGFNILYLLSVGYLFG